MSDVREVRVERRVEPRFGVAIAGAGVLIAVVGAIGLAADQTGGVTDPNRVPGIAVSLALLAGGVALVQRFRTGALALAGSVAAAVAVPALVVFATIADEDFPGFDLAATLLVSALAWAMLHVVCDRRLLFLTAALVAAPLFVMEATEEISNVPEVIGYGFTSAFMGVSDFPTEFEDVDGDGYDDYTGYTESELETYVAELDAEMPEPPDAPDPTVLGMIAMVFAVLYAGVGQVLARGVGTPPTVVGALLAALGIALLSGDLQEAASGLVLVGLGASIAWFGVAAARRFTTWWGALLLGVGVTVLLSEALGDDPDPSGASGTALVVGAAVVLLGHLVGLGIGEPPEEGRDEGRAPEAPGPLPVVEMIVEDE